MSALNALLNTSAGNNKVMLALASILIATSTVRCNR